MLELRDAVEQMIPPKYKLLCTPIGEIAGGHPGDQAKHVCANSILGQVRHYGVIARLSLELKFTTRALEELADYVTRYSLSGIAAQTRKEAGVHCRKTR